jgi:hypothetical protein
MMMVSLDGYFEEPGPRSELYGPPYDVTDLELVEDRRFGNGVVMLRYAVRRP